MAPLDCGTRDGLQPHAPLAPGVRSELARRLVAAGAPRAEVASVASPRAVPAMAGVSEVLAELGPSPTWWVVVPIRPRRRVGGHCGRRAAHGDRLCLAGFGRILTTA